MLSYRASGLLAGSGSFRGRQLQQLRAVGELERNCYQVLNVDNSIGVGSSANRRSKAIKRDDKSWGDKGRCAGQGCSE
jgi:hypothetical protein